MNKFDLWVEDNYNTSDEGYFKDVVVCYRVYYTKDEVTAEYDKIKHWCESDENYLHKVLKIENYEKYFR